jgi:hypothetical protein
VTTVRNGLVRLTRAWRALAVEQRHAAMAALALFVTTFLPWYHKDAFVSQGGKLLHGAGNLNAFDKFGWVEAAIFLVSLGVLMLLFYRAEQRAFHLPGGDGTVILGAGLWAAFLLLWRVFDRPDPGGTGATIGIQWGFFFAFIASGALAYAGLRIRTSQHAEPTRVQDPTTRQEPAPPPRPQVAPSQRRRRRPAGAAGPDADTKIAGQLSFDEGYDDPTGPY